MRIDRDHLVLASIAAAFTAVFIVGLWMPHHRDLATKQQQVHSAQQELARHVANAANPIQVEEVPSELTISNDEIELAIPTGAELGPLLTQVGEDLQDNSVTDQQVQTRPILEGSDFNRVPLTLRFKGSYDALFKFLQRVEMRRRIIRIDRLSIRRDKSQSDDAVVVDIELSTFFRSSVGGAT